VLSFEERTAFLGALPHVIVSYDVSESEHDASIANSSNDMRGLPQRTCATCRLGETVAPAAAARHRGNRRDCAASGSKTDRAESIRLVLQVARWVTRAATVSFDATESLAAPNPSDSRCLSCTIICLGVKERR
jgi:hypothetical protein